MKLSKDEQEFVERMAQGLAAWEAFPAGGRALVVGAAPGMAQMLRECSLIVVEAASSEVLSGAENVAGGAFDVVLMVAEPERVKEPVGLLSACHALLEPHGRLLLGMNNRLGLRYFCGDADLYTDRSFDGIDDYQQVYRTEDDTFRGRMYSRAEICRMLVAAGFEAQKFFAVVSDLAHPMLLYAEGYLPHESLVNRVFPTYHRPEHVFLPEECLYQPLVEEGMFHAMANAYFIECPLDGAVSDVLHVTSSLDRRKEDALLTIVRGTEGRAERVEKRAAFPEGQARLEEIAAHHAALRAHGIRTVEDRLADGVYEMPYVTAPTAQVYFQSLLKKGDRTAFLAALDAFRDAVLASSEHEAEDTGDGAGVVLAQGYLDMVPINAFYQDGAFVFFDQEFVMEHCPANVILMRVVGFLCSDPAMKRFLPREALLERYGLAKKEKQWNETIQAYFSNLRQVSDMMAVRGPHERDGAIVDANRLRCSYPAKRYQELFVDIFSGLEERQLVVFGTGQWAERFLDGYGSRYPVAHLVDNQVSRQGQELRGHVIESPDVLRTLPRDSFKVLICVKGYLSIARQLEEMGITSYACFAPQRDYPSAKPVLARKTVEAASSERKDEVAPAKKYHVGYIAGVFDLFHKGHLNLLRRAKEQCDFLIVGVVSDAGVRKFKQVEPFIPEEERLEIVRACRYVDQAEILPLSFAGTRDAWHLFHFDVQFSGSDYQENAAWLSEREFLKRQGADLVFFPYTQSTSSTRIKSLIQKKLL